MTELNHHAGVILPYYQDTDGTLYFIFEQKDPKYKKPFFDNGLNFLGGNYNKGINYDLSPEETVRREIAEEFGQIYEAPESINQILGQKFQKEDNKNLEVKLENLKELQIINDILQSNLSSPKNYILTTNPPIMKTPVTQGLSVFPRVLDKTEYQELKRIINMYNGTLTTDNHKWGSKIVFSNLEKINYKNQKFAWGYGRTLNKVFNNQGVIRPIDNSLISVKPLEYDSKLGTSSVGGPTYQGLEKAGFIYKYTS